MKAPLSWLREYVPIEMGVDEIASRPGPHRHRGGAGGRGRQSPGRREPQALRRRQGPRMPPTSRRRQAVGVRGRRGRGVAAHHRMRRAERGRRADGGRGAAGRGDARRHPHTRGEAPGRRVVGHDHVRGRDRAWPPRARAPWCCPTTGRQASCSSEYFPISDQVLEVEVTPNRPDCLSVRGWPGRSRPSPRRRSTRT